MIEDDDEVEDVNRNEYAGMYRALRDVLTHRHPATVNRRRMEEAMAQQNEVEKMRQEGGSLKGVYKLSERENDAQRQLRKYKMSPEVLCFPFPWLTLSAATRSTATRAAAATRRS